MAAALHMATALPGAGEVAASVPLYVEDVDADVGRFVPLCVAARIDTAALKLKMRLDGDNEVFQQWEQREEEDGGVSAGVADPAAAISVTKGCGGGGDPATLFSPVIRHCTTGEIKGYNPERARPVVYHFFHRVPAAFDLHEECQFISSLHSLVTCVLSHYLFQLWCIRIRYHQTNSHLNCFIHPSLIAHCILQRLFSPLIT